MLASFTSELEHRIGASMAKEIAALTPMIDGLNYQTLYAHPDIQEMKKSIGRLLTLASELQNAQTTMERLEKGLDELLAPAEVPPEAAESEAA